MLTSSTCVLTTTQRRTSSSLAGTASPTSEMTAQVHSGQWQEELERIPRVLLELDGLATREFPQASPTA